MLKYFHENGDSMLNIPKNTIELKDVESLKTILNSRTISLSIGSRIFHLRAGNAKDALFMVAHSDQIYPSFVFRLYF